jgi:uncharacterized protein
MRHEAVARGAAIGVFWAFAIPVAQFLFAAAHCVLWRGNIPVAAGLTLITNPFTLGFWLWLAYRVGSTLLGTRGPAPMADASGIMAWLTTYGGPALLGMSVFAVMGAVITYLVVKLAWRVRIFFKLKRRRR